VDDPFSSRKPTRLETPKHGSDIAEVKDKPHTIESTGGGASELVEQALGKIDGLGVDTGRARVRDGGKFSMASRGVLDLEFLATVGSTGVRGGLCKRVY
jgi:hypothetical protein